MSNKKPALLQAFYKIVYATEPAVLTGQDIMYIFKDDSELLNKFCSVFKEVLDHYNNAKFCLSANLNNGNFVIYMKDRKVNLYVEFDTVTEEELFMIQSSKERHYFESS